MPDLTVNVFYVNTFTFVTFFAIFRKVDQNYYSFCFIFHKIDFEYFFMANAFLIDPLTYKQ